MSRDPNRFNIDVGDDTGESLGADHLARARDELDDLGRDDDGLARAPDGRLTTEQLEQLGKDRP